MDSPAGGQAAAAKNPHSNGRDRTAARCAAAAARGRPRSRNNL